MCGIAGVVAVNRPVDPRMVQRMCATQVHRGPDSHGLFADPSAALGVQRLAVIDVQGGSQPITNEDGSVVVILNGEIYNYLELAEELRRCGHRFRTGSDTEVLAHLYEELGPRCVERLRGMFAFAIWDRDERRLTLARDRVGKKPLFFAERGGWFGFASELRALLASGELPREVDYNAIDLFLHYQCVPSHVSAFSGIRKLPPAHTLTWCQGRVELRRYWKLSYRDRPDLLSDREACALIRQELLEATRLRLRSDVPLGVLLSGGVDSSAVVAAMARLGVDPLRTFAAGFDDPDFDESARAREVARLHGADHHELILDARAMAILPRLVWHYGEPFADSSALATLALADYTAREVTVVLTGDGGDENFAGYRRYLRFAGVPEGPGDPPYVQYAARRAKSYFDEPARDELYEPGFRALLGERDSPSVLREAYLASDANSVVEKLLDLDVQSYLPDDLLVKMDTAAMAYSLEARSPLLDQSIMELAASLPIGAKVDRDATKKIFREAMREWLPDHVLDWPKKGFMIPVGRWLRHDLPHLAADVLLDTRTRERGLFREQRLQTLIAEHMDGGADHGYRLWTLIELELWFRTYVDRCPSNGPLAMTVA